MLGLIRWCFSTLFILVILIFALINLEMIDLHYSPFHAPISVPFALVIAVFTGAGFFMGGLLVWFQYGPLSKRAFETRKEKRKKSAPSSGSPKKDLIHT
jgi:uncharacterized integral membrane protein